jgi:hypothetical protein
MASRDGETSRTLLCPSAQPEMARAQIIGVVERTGEEARVAYLNERLPLSGEMLAMAGTVKATTVFRIGAHCEEQACSHFDGTRCQLATRIVQILPAVSEALPACVIRSECRWYAQEGRAACLRCPQVVTEICHAGEAMRRAAQPAVSGG